MSPLANAGLDQYVSQELSKLTACTPQSLASEFPDRATWLTEFVFRRIFHDHVKESHAALAFMVLRRADAALDEWELACATSTLGPRQPSIYFKLLRHLETSLACLNQGLEAGRKALGIKLYEGHGHNVYGRLAWIYNKGRHELPTEATDLHRVWLTNDGIHTREYAVTLDEMRTELAMLGRIAQALATGLSPT